MQNYDCSSNKTKKEISGTSCTLHMQANIDGASSLNITIMHWPKYLQTWSVMPMMVQLMMVQ